MKSVILLLFSLYAFNLDGQILALKGIKLVEVDSVVQDFQIKNDKKAYSVLMDLITESNSYTEIKAPILTDDALYGYYLFFEEFEVIYIMNKGGIVLGRVIDKRKEEVAN